MKTKEVPVIIFCSLLLILWSFVAKAGNHDSINAADSISSFSNIGDFLKNGKFSGRLRIYNLSTINKAALSDYYASAYGLGLSYESPQWHHLFAAMSGFLTNNISSSDFLLKDKITGINNRYEIGLYDVINPGKKSGLAKIENLYLGFTNKYINARLGKQAINTPLVNIQDSRMTPNYISGFWLESKFPGKFNIYASWISSFSPRSTINWFSAANTYGIYSSGVNEHGEKSDYKNNIATAGLGIFGITYKNKKIKIQSWDYLAENVFNTIFTQADLTLPLPKNGNTIKLGTQILRQNTIANGGNLNPDKTYILPGHKSGLYGAMIGYGNKKWFLSYNYLYITKEGRFLMPREWGKEQFYVTLPRERVEGAGNVKAQNIKLQYNFDKAGLKAETAYGYYQMPDVLDFRLNKYGLPSYDHFYLSLQKNFNGWFKNTEARLIYVYKGLQGNTYGDAKYNINKADMHHLDLIINFHF